MEEVLADESRLSDAKGHLFNLFLVLPTTAIERVSPKQQERITEFLRVATPQMLASSRASLSMRTASTTPPAKLLSPELRQLRFLFKLFEHMEEKIVGRLWFLVNLKKLGIVRNEDSLFYKQFSFIFYLTLQRKIRIAPELSRFLTKPETRLFLEELTIGDKNQLNNDLRISLDLAEIIMYDYFKLPFDIGAFSANYNQSNKNFFQKIYGYCYDASDPQKFYQWLNEIGRRQNPPFSVDLSTGMVAR
jgi:hypothetical protein